MFTVTSGTLPGGASSLNKAMPHEVILELTDQETAEGVYDITVDFDINTIEVIYSHTFTFSLDI